MGDITLSGPDLTRGIDASELADGAMLTGHAGGKPVLLARRGDELFAVSAACTHYNAPLGDGLLVGETVRCPWHHACFDLRTGEAVRAPAMRALEVFDVHREGERIFVNERPSSALRAPSPRTRGEGQRVGGPSPRESGERVAEGRVRGVVIIGAGAAGTFAANELRKHGQRVTLISRETELPYDKPNLSKDYLAGNAPEEWIPLRSREEYDGVDLRLGSEVTSIDTNERIVRLGDGDSIRYDALILATGAEARKAQGDALTLRSWNDARRIIEKAREAKRAMVIGGGFIGLEVGASLRTRGLDVTVVARDERPLERVFGAEVAQFIRDLHESHGVVFRHGTVDADLVIAGIGVTPSLQLASDAGLDVDNGILVDEYLQTSVPDVYAAGDVARWPYDGERIRVEHWAVAARMGQTAARNAMGRREPFRAVPFFWSAHYDVVLAYVGHAARWDSVDIRGSLADRNAAIAYRRDGRIVAVVTLFRDDISLAAEAAMERGDHEALEQLFH